MGRIFKRDGLIAVVWIVIFLMLIPIGCSREKEKSQKTRAKTEAKVGKEKVIKIGAILPLTGPAAEFGVDDKNGILLAIEDINKKGGIKGRKVVVLFEDSRNDPKTAISAFNKILNMGKPNALFVCMSSISMVLKPLIEKNKIPTFSVAAAPVLTKNARYIFRLLPTTAYQAQTLAKLIQEQRKKRIGVFYINDDFGRSFNTSFSRSAEELNLNLAFSFSFAKDGVDFRNLITKALRQEPTAIVLAGYGSALGILIKQLREAGYKGPIYGTPEMGYPRVISIIGKDIGDAYIVDFDIDYTHHKVKEFVSRYQKRFGRKPSIDAFLGYDAIGLIAEGYKIYMRDHLTELREGILKIKNYNGVVGVLSVKSNGNVEFSLKLRRL